MSELHVYCYRVGHFCVYCFSGLDVSLVLFNALSRTGKTLLAKTLARFVNVPFVIADATTLTQESFVPLYYCSVIEGHLCNCHFFLLRFLSRYALFSLLAFMV